MIIRNAKKEDAAQLAGLLAQMGTKFEMNQKAIEERVAAFAKNDHQIMVAEKGNLIVGVIAYGCYEQFRLSGSCCHIDTLVVDKNYRGKSIGKQLMAVAEKFASDNGAIIIELITANHRKSSGTHAFYKALGYKDNQDLDYSCFSKDT
jgi:GNAT superfamily N-acetyltransferase